MNQMIGHRCQDLSRASLIALGVSWIFAVRPATLTVTNLADSGPGTLRDRLAAAVAGDTINFGVTGTITLSSAELTVAVPASIYGPGPSLLAVSGNKNRRVFTVRGGPTQISGLTIRDGLAIGAEGSQGQDGSNGQGGGIFNQSTLTLSNCVVSSNSVVGGLGGQRHLGFVGSGGGGLGGGIYNAGANLFLFNCSFEGNSSLGGQGGGAVNGDAGAAGNGLGGAICTIGGTNQITACTLLNNLAMGGGGGVSTNSGTAGNRGQGYGAGLYSESSVALFGSTISGGSAIGGASGSSTGSGYGGGIYNITDLALSSCTIASNSVTGSSFDAGGGIYNVGTLESTNSTIAGNQADFGGGLNGNANAAGTIFAANAAGTGPDVNGTINSFDYNLLQSSGSANIIGAMTHVIVGPNPLLGPLQNNGGPTFTMALLPGSPAIDQGKNFGFTTDQRGLPRPWDLPSVANAAGGDGSVKMVGGTDNNGIEFLPMPQLNIERANNSSVILFWSTDEADFNLQSVTNLLAANNWSNVTNARVTIGSQVYVTNSATGASRFYRLSFP